MNNPYFFMLKEYNIKGIYFVCRTILLMKYMERVLQNED